jgi:hypothetical protein
MAVFTNNGLTLIATALETNGAQVAPTWVAVGTGCGTLQNALSPGTSYTSLQLDLGIPVGLASSQSLTITDGTNSQTVTTSGSVTAGATNIPVTSFTASANFAAHTTGVAPTPAVTDLTLYNEIVRVAALPGVAGASPGESLVSAYFDGTQATHLYLQVGYFGGAASSTLGSGTLMMEDVQYWNHTLNADSATFQADSVI